MIWVYGDNVTKRGFPVVGTLIIGINVLVFMFMAGLWRQDLESAPSSIKTIHARGYFRSYAERDDYLSWLHRTKYGSFIHDWGLKSTHLQKGHVLCVLSHMFMHDGFAHIFGNMLMLWAILSTLEITMGQFRFLFCYLFWGLSAAAAQTLMNWTSDVPGVGASGAIAGMMGAYLVAFGALTKVRAVWFFFKPFYFMIPTSVFMVCWVLLQLFGMSGDEKGHGGGVAYAAHLGGFIAGALTMLVIKRSVVGKMTRNKAGELQALDEEEVKEIEAKKARAKAPLVSRQELEASGLSTARYQPGLKEPAKTEGEHEEGEGGGAPRGEGADSTAIQDHPSERAEGDGEKDKEEEGEAVGAGAPSFKKDADALHGGKEDEDAGPKGVRPWHVILGISGLMLAAAAFVAMRDKREEGPAPLLNTQPEDKPPERNEDFVHRGKPLGAWIEELRGAEPETRRTTASTLATVDANGAKALTPLLLETIKDEDRDVRQLSAYVLGNLKGELSDEVIGSLETALRDKEKMVRRAATTALIQRAGGKPERLQPVLEKALADPDKDVRRTAVEIRRGVDPEGTQLPTLKIDLQTARLGFKTKLVPNSHKPGGPASKPPADVFTLIQYESSGKKLAAYVTPDPRDGKQHPAVLWAHGGFAGIGNYFWLPSPRNNDQSARAFREAGIVLMCPSWRRENDNPGKFELFFGEVDDLLAAREYLENVPYVDPERIYLAGHSTGGTLTLLAATATDLFRAAFSFGGAPDMERVIASGGYKNTPFDVRSSLEGRMRSPILYTSAIRRPVFYFEGEDSSYNDDAALMEKRAQAAGVPFQAFKIRNGNHFDILDPLTRLVARKILLDRADTCNIRLTAEEVQNAFNKRKR